MEQECLSLLLQCGKTLATAESCTGGMIAERITDIPGASAVFMGGVVSYTNAVKHKVLSVSQEYLEEYGAVSAPVAKAMAEGVRRCIGADIGVSVTGVAGPAKDDRGNPVGTVFIALADGEETFVRAFSFGEHSRSDIRTMAADSVLALLLEYLKK